uniref:Uncharacterized protein n=1 Tax=Lotharella oceanica TaxID=641309 RepID=A0A7S2XAY3_9EUKA|mmetsp:Transcript_24656/g.46076  ORF Transcript_24656/g.46076 Transcript_24656/m.46076 type:complete len:185 (+) Transcript_24656:168-722(+)
MGKIRTGRIKTPQHPLSLDDACAWGRGVLDQPNILDAGQPKKSAECKENASMHVWVELFSDQRAQERLLDSRIKQKLRRQHQNQRKRQSTSFGKRLQIEISRRLDSNGKSDQKVRTGRFHPRRCTNMVIKHVKTLLRPRPLAILRRKRMCVNNRAPSLEKRSHEKKFSWDEDNNLNRPMSELAI